MKTYIIKFDGITQAIKAHSTDAALNQFRRSNRLKGMVTADIREVNNEH